MGNVLVSDNHLLTDEANGRSGVLATGSSFLIDVMDPEPLTSWWVGQSTSRVNEISTARPQAVL